jgi:flagellar L-ring protein precursor FlgH
MKKQLKAFLIVAVVVGLSGCASLDRLLGRNQNKSDRQSTDNRPAPPSFSEQDNYHAGNQRQYRRMTKEQFEKDSQVGAGEGSLWVMEGQGSYLFAQNNNHIVGDILTINLDGAPKEQLQNKVKVIGKLLERLDKQSEPFNPLMRAPTSTAASSNAGPVTPGTAKSAPKGAGAPGTDATNPAAAATPAVADSAAPKAETAEPKFEVETVPARVVEVLKDGSYKVQGSQSFMIGKREYKTIVSGIVRPPDFNEDGTLASRLQEGQFDVVSSKKGMAAL